MNGAPVAPSVFSGVVNLNDGLHTSYLQYQDGSGNTHQPLMIMDPGMTGNFDPAGVNAVYDFYHATLGHSGVPRTVKGFLQVAGGSSVILHVVTP